MASYVELLLSAVGRVGESKMLFGLQVCSQLKTSHEAILPLTLGQQG